MTDHSDLIAKLRACATERTGENPYQMLSQAVEALSSQSLSLSEAREEIAGLRKALRTIAEPIVGTPIGDPWAFYVDLQAVAVAALVSGSREDGDG